jgi:hypothetical protein
MAYDGAFTTRLIPFRDAPSTCARLRFQLIGVGVEVVKRTAKLFERPFLIGQAFQKAQRRI